MEWQWLDGNEDGTAECYAFDSEGWMYAGGLTPDGYSVNGDGAWTINEAVQTMAVAAGYGGTEVGKVAEQTEARKVNVKPCRVDTPLFLIIGKKNLRDKVSLISCKNMQRMPVWEKSPLKD